MSPQPTFPLKKSAAPKPTKTTLSGRVSSSSSSKNAKARKADRIFSPRSLFKLLAWAIVPFLILSIVTVAPSLGFSSDIQYRLIWVLISLSFYALFAFAYIMFGWYQKDCSSKWLPRNSDEAGLGMGIGFKSRIDTRR